MIKRTGSKLIFQTKYFKVMDIDLENDSGEKVTYQIIERPNTAMLVPIDENNNLILVKEYFYALDEYQLGLPKGMIDNGSDEFKTANKELQEETGYQAGKLDKLGLVTMSPGYNTQKTHLFLARELSENKLQGDELEKLEVIKYPFDKFDELIDEGKITDSRMIAALFLARKVLLSENNTKGKQLDT